MYYFNWILWYWFSGDVHWNTSFWKSVTLGLTLVYVRIHEHFSPWPFWLFTETMEFIQKRIHCSCSLSNVYLLTSLVVWPRFYFADSSLLDLYLFPWQSYHPASELWIQLHANDSQISQAIKGWVIMLYPPR